MTLPLARRTENLWDFIRLTYSKAPYEEFSASEIVDLLNARTDDETEEVGDVGLVGVGRRLGYIARSNHIVRNGLNIHGHAVFQLEKTPANMPSPIKSGCMVLNLQQDNVDLKLTVESDAELENAVSFIRTMWSAVA